MRQCTRPTKTPSNHVRLYRKLSLVELARKITEHADREALREFHDDRAPFRGSDGHPLRFAEYLLVLRDGAWASSWARHNAIVLDKAYDLTMDKFHCLPNPGSGASPGPDCRKYFKAFVAHVAARISAERVHGELEVETIAGAALQQLVGRHFILSCLDHQRNRNGLVRRYVWHVDGRTICLRFPSHMTGRQCRTWLLDNIDNPDAARPLERERVQAVVDERLVMPRLLSGGDLDGRSSSKGGVNTLVVSPTVTAITDMGLAQAVSEEKAEHIDQQRTNIRKLGPQPLKGLVLRIFEDLCMGQYNLSGVALSFGLDKTTLSRFAGGRWIKKARDGARVVIPDLWRNTAHTVAGHPDFVDAARAAGVWPMIESILKGTRGEP